MIVVNAAYFRRRVCCIFPPMDPKQRAAEAAMEFVQSGMVLGLGTGSTADQFLRALAAALKAGSLRDIRGVPTSLQSERRALELGIPLTTLIESPRPDVTIDGADEVAPNLDLIKGLGGALLREKMVAQNSARLVIIADSGKAVQKLGTHAPLPVEVTQFAREVQEHYLRSVGGTPVLRRAADGSIYITDNGNMIYDCRFPNGIDHPHDLERSLQSRAGIVGHGLFLEMASVALIADAESVRTISIADVRG